MAAEARAFARDLAAAERPSREQLAQLAALTAAHPGEFFADADDCAALLDSLVALLNREDEAARTKVTALAALANLCLEEAQRDRMLGVLQLLGPALEANLADRVASRRQGFSSGGSVGPLHQAMLVAMCRVCDYRLRASYLREFANGDVALALELVLSVAQVRAYETPLVCCVVSMLRGFSQPDTYVDSSSGGVEGSVAQVCAAVSALVDVSMRDAVVEKTVAALAPRLQRSAARAALSAPERTCVMALLEFVSNVHQFATRQGTAFRQHLLVSTGLVDGLLRPYVANCLQHQPACGAGDEARFLASNPVLAWEWALVLKTLVLVTFRMGPHLPAARAGCLAADMLRARSFLAAHPSLVALVLLYLVNVSGLSESESESSEEEYDPAETLALAREVLRPPELRAEVRRLLLRPSTVPVSRDCASFEVALGLTSPGSDESAGAESAGAESAGAQAKGEEEEEEEEAAPKAEKKGPSLRLLGDLPSLAPAAKAAAKGPGDGAEPGQGVESKAAVATTAALRAPAEFRCAINGHVMKDPVRSPYGDVFERLTVELWLRRRGPECPVTQKTLEIEDLEPMPELAQRITEWHIARAIEENTGATADDIYDF